MMTRNWWVGVLIGLGLVGSALPPAASAAMIVFDFNALKDEDPNAAVQTYMNGVLATAHPGGTAAVSGSKAEKEYAGDGHVVGPVLGSTVRSDTLGNSDGGTHHNGMLDTFLVNTKSDRITMKFSFPIYSVVFDYEIFPDGTCSQASLLCQPSTSNWPDLTFVADGIVQFTELGIVPGTSGTFPHSPNSTLSKNEKAPQYLGMSGERVFAQGVKQLEFIDWPQMIGIDNLTVHDTPPVRNRPRCS